MSNQYLKLRRSNVKGKIPTTESIDFGEIALNTFDGIAYMKVSGSEGIKVVPIGANSGSVLFDPSKIVSGSVVASVNTNPNEIFLIKSGSTTFHQIANNGDTSVYSDLFIIKNNTTQQPVLTISQSIIQFATQSAIPLGSAVNGGFWFTPTDLYVGLD
jgi:hypothetical protein